MANKKTNTITIRLDDDLKQKIDYQANTEHRETSEFVRHCIQVYIEKIEEVRKLTGTK